MHRGLVRRRRLARALLLVLLGVAGCAGGLGPESGVAEEARIAAAVKAALAREPEVAAAAIDVTVSGALVRLGGLVETASQRSRAAVVASGVAGVRGVINKLVVK